MKQEKLYSPLELMIQSGQLTLKSSIPRASEENDSAHEVETLHKDLIEELSVGSKGITITDPKQEGFSLKIDRKSLEINTVDESNYNYNLDTKDLLLDGIVAQEDQLEKFTQLVKSTYEAFCDDQLSIVEG
jgi:hypothetical protein